MSQRPLPEMVTLPDGSAVFPGRPRSDGPLTRAELAACRSQSVPVAWDPLQSGWVPADVHDDLSPNAIMRSAEGQQTRSGLTPAPNIVLRHWTQADLPAYHRLLDDPEVWATLPEDYPDPLIKDMAASLIELSNGANHHKVLAVEADGVPVGQVRLQFDVDEADSGVAEISYWFGRAHWGRGLASTAVSIFAQKSLDDHPGLTRLIAKVLDGNRASFRVLEKAGFTVDGPDRLPGWTRLHLRR